MDKTSMKLHFEGAHGTVTGSCTWLEYRCRETTANILVDCGVEQDSRENILKPNWTFNPEKITCVLLTHAHIDHCGAIPILYNVVK
ncbi:MAG: MBL fold metallo-hydrolase [Treponema sp.]|nr:MBL fold metallo-hydrolase [Treponema sp.]